MNDHERARFAFHGGIVLFIGLLCGLAAVTEPEGQPMPSWQAAHGGLLLNGVWLLATAGMGSVLALERSHAEALRWSLLGMAYGFMLTVLVQAATGVRGVGPGGPAANWVAFVGNLVVVLCAFFAAGLTVAGAHGWMRQARRVPARDAAGD